MIAIGVEAYLSPEDQSCIITTFRYPADPWFNFENFHSRLSERGFIIYPGKLISEACFRIGTIGRLFPVDIASLLQAIERVLAEAGIALQPVTDGADESARRIYLSGELDELSLSSSSPSP
jgi:2-aminoethylphosphonate-pyruvate transaminase